MKNSSILFLVFLFFQPTTFAQWTQWEDIPTARWASASCTVDGKIYVIGGGQTINSSLNKMEVYDPLTDAWDTTKTPMPTARVELGACAVNGKIYAIGGATNHSASPLDNVEEYDPLTNTWNPKMAMLTARKGAAYGVIDNKIYVAGGTAFANFTASNKLEIYDPATDTWIDTLDTMDYAVYEPEGAVINDTFYVIGGLLGYPPWTGQKIVQMYDPITDIWFRLADLDSGRVGHSTNVVSGKIYVIGGDRQPPPVRNVEEYDPNSDTWNVIASTPNVIMGHTASVFGNKIYIFSGTMTFPNLTPTSVVYSFDPDSVVNVDLENNLIPEYFVLYQAYPNPFNPSTTIKYSVPKSSKVIIKVYDVLGNEIETLVNEEKSTGTYKITWFAENLPSGVYFYQLRAGDFIETKKMVLMK